MFQNVFFKSIFSRLAKASAATVFILSLFGFASQSQAARDNSFASWQHEGWTYAQAETMGTRIAVTLWHEDDAVVQQGIDAVLNEMQRINQHFSPWIESSELAQLNATAAKAPVVLSEEMWLLISKSMWVSQVSQGAFDITFASVGWHYDYRKEQQPSEEDLKRLLPAVNYRGLLLDKQTKSLKYAHPDIRVDLGGIAKGYAVDNSITLLQQLGIKHAMVSAGGDSRVLGDKRGRPWLVGIKNPRAQAEEKNTEPVIYLPLEDTAVSTSGDYERYFIDKSSGKRVHHIINPKTGESASGVISVTVLADKGLDADPLSTTVFVLGVEKGLNLVNGLQGVDCIIIDASGKVHYSTGLTPPEPEK